jgi:hypothetical protein
VLQQRDQYVPGSGGEQVEFQRTDREVVDVAEDITLQRTLPIVVRVVANALLSLERMLWSEALFGCRSNVKA